MSFIQILLFFEGYLDLELSHFHKGHHPSISFHERTNTFRCWSCRAHGDVINLTRQVLGKDVIDTCRWLGNGYCILRQPEAEYRQTRQGVIRAALDCPLMQTAMSATSFSPGGAMRRATSSTMNGTSAPVWYAGPPNVVA